MNRWLSLLLVAFSLAAQGCARDVSRLVTITASPADADLTVDDRNAGRAPRTREFVFTREKRSYVIGATRFGYTPATFELTSEFGNDKVLMVLRPRTRTVTLRVGPQPALITVDGKRLNTEPVSQISTELEFRVDSADHWLPHTISAERPGFLKADRVVRWEDQTGQYDLNLTPLTKSVRILTDPPGAEVFVGDESHGQAPVTLENLNLSPADPAKPAERVVVKALLPGLDPGQVAIGWDDGKSDYTIKLGVKSKQIKITPTPPEAAVAIDGVTLTRDEAGAWTGKVSFEPLPANGALPTFTVKASLKTDDAEWEPAAIQIGWDDGKSEYPIELRERARKLTLLRPTPVKGNVGWTVSAEKVTTWSLWDVGEPSGRKPMQLTYLPRGQTPDAPTLSPDGRQIAYTSLAMSDRGALTGAIHLANADGTFGGRAIGDGKGIELNPSFAPDGRRVLFSSDRWSGPGIASLDLSAGSKPEPVLRSLTAWSATIDSLPRPHLYCESITPNGPRLYCQNLAADGTTAAGDPIDLKVAGRQPRVRPQADLLAYVETPDPKSPNRRIRLMALNAQPGPVLPSNTGWDEFDPAWSRDGGRLAYASNRPPIGAPADAPPGDYNIWIVDTAAPDRPIQVTSNGSWDDSPSWDPLGRSIAFRSNRGGEWAVWRIDVPSIKQAGTRPATPPDRR